MPTAVVDGNSRRWEVGVGKRTHGDAHRLIAAVFSVEDGSPTKWAESVYELGSLISDTNVFGGGAEHFERSREAGQCSEDTAGPLLACEAVAKANASWFAFDLNAQLSAGTRGCSGRHLAPRRDVAVVAALRHMRRNSGQIHPCLARHDSSFAGDETTCEDTEHCPRINHYDPNNGT